MTIYFFRFFALIATIMVGISTFAETVKLVRPLGAYEEETLNRAHAIEIGEYYSQLRLSFYSLGLGTPDHFTSERRMESKLRTQDQVTLIETELQRLQPGFLGARNGRNDVLEQMVESKTFGRSKPKDIYNLLGKLFLSSESSSEALYSGTARRAYLNMIALPTFYQFLIILYERQVQDTRYTKDFWQPLIDATYNLIRKELVYLDFEIKVATPIEAEQADQLAVGIMAILLSAETPYKEQILDRLFDGIDQSFTINARANRYLTRTVDWLHDNVLTPTRRIAFRVMVVALFGSMIAYGTDSPDLSQISDTLGTISAGTWFALWLENYFGGRAYVTGAFRLLDQAANLIGSTVSRNRRGPLSEYISTPREHMRTLCEKTLAGSGN